MLTLIERAFSLRLLGITRDNTLASVGRIIKLRFFLSGLGGHHLRSHGRRNVHVSDRGSARVGASDKITLLLYALVPTNSRRRVGQSSSAPLRLH